MSKIKDFYLVTKQESEKIEICEDIIYTNDYKETVCMPYLKDLFTELASISSSSEKGINKIVFIKAFKLPVLIGERLFKIMADKKTDTIPFISFLCNTMKLYSNEFDIRMKFIFDIFDFDSDGEISREDIRIILSYIPIESSDSPQKSITILNPKFVEFQDIVESQVQLDNLLDTAFQNKFFMNFKDFKFMIENESSDFFICVYLFLRQCFPTFSQFNQYNKNRKDLKEIQTPSKKNVKVIATPKVLNKFSPMCELISPSPKKKSTNDVGKGNYKKSKFYYEKENINENDDHCIKLINTNYSQPKINLNLCQEEVSPRKINLSEQVVRKPNMKILGSDVVCSPSVKLNTPIKDRVFCVCGKEVKNINYPICPKCEGNQNLYLLEGVIYILKELPKKYYFYFEKGILYLKEGSDSESKKMICFTSCLFEDSDIMTIKNSKYYTFNIYWKNKKVKYGVEDQATYEKLTSQIKALISYGDITNSYELIKELGSTHFGKVMLAKYKKTGQQVAIKIFTKKLMNESDLEMVFGEVEILKQCQHPNIIKLIDFFESLTTIYIVMEYLSGSDLFTYLEKRDFQIPEAEARHIIHCMAAALFYLHNFGIIHRDLKAENIMLVDDSEELKVKLVDFGFSIIAGPKEKCDKRLGTINYAAPEIIVGNPYGKEVDIWSLGILTHLLLYQFLPYDSDNDNEIMEQIVHSDIDYKGEYMKTKSLEGKLFVKKCLNKYPCKRPTIEVILQDEWLVNSKEKILLARKKKNETPRYIAFSTITGGFSDAIC